MNSISLICLKIIVDWNQQIIEELKVNILNVEFHIFSSFKDS